ncbi:hypothetical protein A2U01_0084952, partial [Trifolium medium]|nr:hypothetical protein [Trifolium medium]
MQKSAQFPVLARRAICPARCAGVRYNPISLNFVLARRASPSCATRNFQKLSFNYLLQRRAAPNQAA